jgi:hypothetical protein
MEWRSERVKTEMGSKIPAKQGVFKKNRNGDCDGDRRDGALKGIFYRLYFSALFYRALTISNSKKKDAYLKERA